jgi:poly(ADP-ribose) glycohydrolase ARH3
MTITKDRVRGTLMGTFVGDALGMPVEGLSYEQIKDKYSIINNMMDGRLKKGSYTDDTQMLIGITESLINKNGFDGQDMAGKFVNNYSPVRGYGKSAAKIIEELKTGVKWDEVSTLVFEKGSYGNGAAMRAAPLSIFYHKCLDDLIKYSRKAAEITHTHILGYQGAILINIAIYQALAVNNLKSLESKIDFINFIKSAYSFDHVYIKSLNTIIDLLQNPVDIKKTINLLGVSVKAHESVPTAIYAFLKNSDSFEKAVIYSVNLGGDTDTIGAMTGSLAGAFYGCSSISLKWLDDLENNIKGKDYVLNLSDKLFNIIK